MRLTDFLEPFFPEMSEPLHLFGFSPKEMPAEGKRAPKTVRTSRAELAANKMLQRDLVEWNRDMGLYFTVNAGGTKKDEITRINAVFCEMDDRPIEEQHDAYDMAWYPPSIRVVTKKSVHAYWMLEDNITSVEFEEIQRGLIASFNSDRALTNVNRVMRLPFFSHLSLSGASFVRTPVTWHTFRPDRRFSLAELREAYCPKPENKTLKFEPYELERLDEKRSAFRALPGYHIEPGGKMAAARGICHGGETDRSLAMFLDTGTVICRAGCDWERVREALGLKKFEKQQEEKRRRIQRVVRPRPKSALYEYVREVNG